MPPSVTNGITLFNQALTTGANTLSTWAAGPWTPLGFGSLVKNWWQVSISIPSLGTGIQGIGPLLHPTPITGALSPLLHSGLLSGALSGLLAGNGVGGAGRHHRCPVGAAELGGRDARRADRCRRDGSVRGRRRSRDGARLSPECSARRRCRAWPVALSAGTATRAAVGQGYRVPGAVATDEIATTATIIVIPPSAE